MEPHIGLARSERFKMIVKNKVQVKDGNDDFV